MEVEISLTYYVFQPIYGQHLADAIQLEMPYSKAAGRQSMSENGARRDCHNHKRQLNQYLHMLRNCSIVGESMGDVTPP